jgi:predicted nucleotidyltransferase
VQPDAIARSLQRFFADDPRGVVAAYLFGSGARGSLRSDSDIDVALLYSSPPEATLSAQEASNNAPDGSNRACN